MPDFLPRPDASLLNWSECFSRNISLSPGEYGITSPQAADYALLHDAFAAAYQLTTQNSTRTPSSIVAKDDARKLLKAMARTLARIVRATPGVVPAQRIALGLNAGIASASPINAPSDAPALFIDAVSGRTVTLRLGDFSSLTRMGKPRGVAGATLFSHIGDEPPASLSDWKFQCNASDRFVQVTFPSNAAPGTSVWFTARWFNPRMETGPASHPVQTSLQMGVNMAA